MRLSTRLRARPWFVVAIFLGFAAILLVPGVVLLVDSRTGIPGKATVGDCETEGAGRFQSTYCTGSWIVGGSLLEGGHVIVGPIEGVDGSDVGKDVDVMIHGDTAYSSTPDAAYLLIGFGVLALALAILSIVLLVRRPTPRARASAPN